MVSCSCRQRPTLRKRQGCTQPGQQAAQAASPCSSPACCRPGKAAQTGDPDIWPAARLRSTCGEQQQALLEAHRSGRGHRPGP